MYADQLAGGRKRSIQERLYGGASSAGVDPRRAVSSAETYGKRQRNTEEKWRYGAYQDDKELPLSRNKLDARDVRLNHLTTGLRQVHHNQKESGAVLREKLSPSVRPQATSKDLPKPKLIPVKTGAVKKSEPSQNATIQDAQKVADNKLLQQKSELSVDGLLQSLGLEKYSITFKKEEIDMAALLHMTDNDLKALGIPMGPRKKIMWALSSKRQKE